MKTFLLILAVICAVGAAFGISKVVEEEKDDDT